MPCTSGGNTKPFHIWRTETLLCCGLRSLLPTPPFDERSVLATVLRVESGVLLLTFPFRVMQASPKARITHSV